MSHWPLILAWLLVALGAPSLAEPATNRALPGAPALQPTRSFKPPPKINYREPAREYAERRQGGWNFFLERELAERQPEQADRVVKRLEAKLSDVLRLLPEHTHDRLRRLSFFVMAGSNAAAGGRDSGLEFFRRTDPDFHPRLDPRWRGAVVIYSAKNYLWQNDYWSVQLLVHELSHAWHLEQWPEKQPDILNAWREAVEARLYHGVKDLNGTILEKAYAAHNQLEYFAELSCAYFWKNEYEPFDREGLRRRDPGGLAMIEKMWGIHAPPPPASPRAGKVE